MDYPATKDSLIDAAAGAEHKEEVQKALQSLPVGNYGNLDEVIRSLDTVEATGQAEADKAVRARDRSHAGLAEYMRDRQAQRLDPEAPREA